MSEGGSFGKEGKTLVRLRACIIVASSKILIWHDCNSNREAVFERISTHCDTHSHDDGRSVVMDEGFSRVEGSFLRR